MRRIVIHTDPSERGAAGVMVSVMMLVLIGAGAMAVDVGQIYAERAQLQNGADAGALAVARSCEVGSCNSSLATGLANANSNDGTSDVKSVDLSVAGQVTVTTATRSGSSSFLSKMFASALSVGPVTVGATSTASWASPGAGPAVLPMAFAPCQFDLNGSLHNILVQGSQTCASDNPSGGAIPGGFEWLQTDPGKCGTTVYPDDASTTGITDPYANTNTGLSMPMTCKPVIAGFLNTVVLFPVFSNAVGNGAGGKYYIKGYAAFRLVGYWFPGFHDGDTTGLSGSDNGVRGRFVTWVADPTVYTGSGYEGGGVDLPPHLIK